MRRSTVIYLVLFVIALGAYFFLKQREARPQTGDVWTPEPTSAIEYLFTSADGLPTRIKIESKTGEVVEVARNEENAWVLIQPEEAAADQGAVEAAATQVTTIRILERIPNLAPDVVGLDVPEYTITFQFTSGVERIIEIGVLTPTTSGHYIRGTDGEIVIVNSNAVETFIRLLENPPYTPTETPVPATP